jgi:hypothetical protein
MSRFSIDPAMTLDGSATKKENPSIALWFWILILTLTPIAFVALMSDATYTSETRIALYLQSGNFP